MGVENIDLLGDGATFELVLEYRKQGTMSCPECGVRQIKVPWAAPKARFTILFEAHVIEVLHAAHSTSQACELPGIGWSTADSIMIRAVQRSLECRRAKELLRLGMDGKSFRAHHRYITSLCDFDRGRVLEVVEGRTEEKAVELLQKASRRRLG